MPSPIALPPLPATLLASIELLVMDVDGVLTDGSIMLDDDGRETKRFNVRDGMGITAWQRAGFKAAVVTRRSRQGVPGGGAVLHRARELSIPPSHVVQGASDKAAAIEELASITGISPAQMAFVGDDWPDIPALRKVGLPVAVGDADEHVKSCVKLILTRPGGRGAVRELVELLLAAKGHGVLEKARG